MELPEAGRTKKLLFRDLEIRVDYQMRLYDSSDVGFPYSSRRMVRWSVLGDGRPVERLGVLASGVVSRKGEAEESAEDVLGQRAHRSGCRRTRPIAPG